MQGSIRTYWLSLQLLTGDTLPQLSTGLVNVDSYDTVKSSCFGDYGMMNKMRKEMLKYVSDDIWKQWKEVDGPLVTSCSS